LQKAEFEEYWVEEWDIPKNKLKLAAQALNSEPGNIETPLTGKEKKKAIIEDWEDGIRDIELIAEALKTTPSYVRKVLSKAGLIKDRKEQMKERALKLREEGLSYRQIAEKLSEEFGEKVTKSSVERWLSVPEFTQVKNGTPQPDREKIKETIEYAKKHGKPISIHEVIEEEPKEETLEYARYKDTDIPLATIEYWVGECRSYVETGTKPEEAVEIVGVHPNVKKYVIEELYERYWKKDSREEEIQKWVDRCKHYIDLGFEPREAVEEGGVPQGIRLAVVKKLVGYKNHRYQEERARREEELGPLYVRREEAIITIRQVVSGIRHIQKLLEEIDELLPQQEEEVEKQLYNRFGRDQYIRDYLLFILVRGGWDMAEWFREATRRYIRYTLHPEYAKEFLEDMKEHAKLSPEEWEEATRRFWEEQLATDQELEWKKFCKLRGLPVPPEYRFGEERDEM